MALALAVVLILGSIGILFGSSKPAGADTPLFASGQVFASVGNSPSTCTAQGSGNPLVTRLNDGTKSLHRRQRLRSSGNFYVTDDLTGTSASTPPTAPSTGLRQRACRTRSLLSSTTRATSTSGSRTPYIAEFSKTGQIVQNIGPLATELSGRRLDRPRSPTSAPSTTRPRDRHPSLQHVHQQAAAELQCAGLPDLRPRRPACRFRPSNCRSSRTGTCSSPTRTRTSCSTPTATSCRPTPVRRCPDARDALRHEPRPGRQLVLDRRLDLGRHLEGRHRLGDVLQTDQHPLGRRSSASPSTTRSRWPHRPPSCPPRLRPSPSSPFSGNFSSPTPVSAVLTNSDRPARRSSTSPSPSP